MVTSPETTKKTSTPTWPLVKLGTFGAVKDAENDHDRPEPFDVERDAPLIRSDT